jgi:Protein of unknown function (DUF3619)
MIEKDFGQSARHYLQASTDQLDGQVAARLAAARQQALAGMPSTQGNLLSNGKNQAVLGLSWTQRALIIIPLAALVIALASANFFKDPNAEVGELDAAILTGELPIDAFLDEDFDAWLKNSQ